MASGIKNGEILINVTPVETRVAVVENGMLQEVYIERSNTRGIVGNIYKGKVVRVLPGMQAAFVDVGLERAAFIHAADVHLPTKDSEFARQKPDHISSLLNEGEEIVVQITKDPIGSKGARLTTRISIPSRYLVYMPDNDHVGISQRIEDEEERNRLRTIVSESVEDENEGGAHADGFILRTAADGVPSEDILADVRFLKRLWGYISASMSNVKSRPLFSKIFRCISGLFGIWFVLILKKSGLTLRKPTKSALVSLKSTFLKWCLSSNIIRVNGPFLIFTVWKMNYKKP